MAEIDPVILELRADLAKYQSELRQTAANAERQLGRQEKAVQRLEKQMLKSSTAISGSLRTIGATLGTFVSGREIVGLVDGFTRLQNSLRVAGLEGAKLETVQSSLLDLSTRYGVGIEGLANLYGKATDAGRSFGASEAQVLQLTEATSQALLITGTSAAQAQGAILGLSQALASGTVRAEEYNQINEGGLRPLLQAAAASERFGGDINKLRAAMLDGKVSSQEFFNSILSGSTLLEGQASKATLTLSGAFEGLTSRLTVYIGQSAQASGITQALAGAMQLLAENLDTIIPALAVIATVLGGRFLAGALAGGTALRTLAAYASIATTSLAGTALAARSAGTALLAAFGGPVGLAISALVITLGIAASRADQLSQASQHLKRSHDAVATGSSAAAKAIDKLAASYGRARAEARLLAEEQLKLSSVRLAAAERDVLSAERDAAKAKANTGRYSGAIDQQAAADVAIAQQNVINERNTNARLRAALNAPPVSPNAAAAAAGTSSNRKPRGGQGPSASDIESRVLAEIENFSQQALSSRQQLATSAQERADLELRALENARRESIRQLEGDKDYSDAQKARVKNAIDNLAEIERERIARDLRVKKEEEAADLADAEFQAQSDALRQQYDLAKSQAARRDLAYEIIDLEYRYRDAALRAVEENEDLADAVRQRAAIERAALADSRNRTMESARRDTAGPLERYFDNAKRDAAELNELYEGIAADGLQSLNDGLADAIVNSKSLGDVFKNVAKQIIADLIRIAIQQQIVNALQSSIGGGFLGGLFGGGAKAASAGSSFGTGLPGRASGGPVEAGRLYRINEAGMEGFVPASSGTIIPAGQMNARAMSPAAQSGGVTVVRLALSGDIDARIDQRSAGVAVEVVRATAPSVIDAAANETLRRAGRPKI